MFHSALVHGLQNKLGGCLAGWLAVFSSNDLSGLRRPQNVKFGTKVVSSTRVMRTLIFLEKVFQLWNN